MRSTTKEVLTSIYSFPLVRFVDGNPVVFVTGIELVDGRGQPALFRVNLKDLSATIEAHGYARPRPKISPCLGFRDWGDQRAG